MPTRPAAERLRDVNKLADGPRLRRVACVGDRSPLCHRRAAIGRGVLGGSSFGARVREERVRDQPLVTLLYHLLYSHNVNESQHEATSTGSLHESFVHERLKR